MTMFVCHLTQRGVLRIGGDDRRSFLQGLISNDINLCVSDKMLYAALLTPQGKFLHDMFIIDDGDSFLIDCEAAHANDLLARLRNHKLRAKVTFENVSDQFDVWVSFGSAASFRRNPDFRRDDASFYSDPRLADLGLRGIFKKSTIPAGQIADFAAYDKHRLMLGVPDGSRDMIIEKSTLLEGNFDLLNGISWIKGCYMGQELTARMHYRALVKKRLYPVKIEGEAPDPGSIIQMDGQEVGEMRSSCEDVGLALLSVEKSQNAVYVCGASKLSRLTK